MVENWSGDTCWGCKSPAEVGVVEACEIAAAAVAAVAEDRIHSASQKLDAPTVDVLIVDKPSEVDSTRDGLIVEEAK